MSCSADVRVEGRGRESEHTREEVAREAVTACGGGGVRAVGANHVVDGGHVNGVIGDADDSRKDHGPYPMDIG